MTCPIEDCEYTATHAEAAVMAALMSVHATVHVAAPDAGFECDYGETEASDRRTCRNGRGLIILHNPLGLVQYWYETRWTRNSHPTTGMLRR